jgi:branched-chain amino acid transport system substrate-binding protein
MRSFLKRGFRNRNNGITKRSIMKRRNIMVRKIWLVSFLAIVACTFLLSSPVSAQQDKVTLAIVAEQSGGGAVVGERWTRGVQMAGDEINASGGILAKKVEFFIIDTKTEAPVAVAAVRKAIASNPFAVMGPVYSGSSIACMGLLAEAGIPQFVASESPNIATKNDPKNPNTFLSSLNVDLSVQKVANWITDVLKTKKMAILWVNNEFGRSGKDALKKVLTPKGVEIVIDLAAELGQSSFTGELARVKSSGADTLFVYMNEEESGKVLPQIREMGIDKQMRIIGETTILTEDTLRLAKDAANGVQGHVGLSPAAAPLKPVTDKYFAKYKEYPDHNFYKGYISMYVLKAAVEDNKSFDQQKFRDRMKNRVFCRKDYPGILMDVYYDGKGDIDRQTFLIKIENQKQTMSGILQPMNPGNFAGCK